MQRWDINKPFPAGLGSAAELISVILMAMCHRRLHLMEVIFRLGVLRRLVLAARQMNVALLLSFWHHSGPPKITAPALQPEPEVTFR